MAEQMSTDLARRVAAHLRGLLDEARRANWMAAPAVLGTRIERFAEKLETGDTSWVVPAMTPEERHAGVLANGPFGHADQSQWPASSRHGEIWGPVDELRRRIAGLLVRVEGTPNGSRKVGYFAVRTAAGPVRFYRVTAPVGGKWDGRVFVDAQASDDYHAVKNPASLSVVLGAILDDPEAAALLYASELGRCSRCARTLTDEESRAAGMGPDCRALAAR